MTYLGASCALTETAPDSLFFTNGASCVTLSGALLADTNVQEWVSASVTFPALGVTNAVYPCVETSAESSAFENTLFGLVFSAGAPSAAPRIADLRITTETLSDDIGLTETAPGSGAFTNGSFSVRLSVAAGTPLLAVTDGFGLSNAVFTVWETAPQSGVYRNYNPPVPTDLPDVPVPDFAPWRIRITGLPQDLLASVSLTTSVDSVTGTYGAGPSPLSFGDRTVTFSASGDDLLSDQAFILIPDRELDADPPAGYTPLRIDDTASRWQDAAAHGVGVEVSLHAMASPARKSRKEKPGAVVLQSLDWMTQVGQGLDPENRIRQPLLEMGYAAVRDYKASVSKTLADYIKGKQVWYSMSHGGTEDRTPHTAFNGLVFRDGPIRASDLEPLDLNYKLVIADGCCSAQTVLTSERDSWSVDTLLPSCQTFADAWGEDSAYMGWSWTMGPNAAQVWSSEFLNNLKFDEDEGRGLTVAEAHQKFLNDNYYVSQKPAPAARNMKIYGSTDNIVETRKVMK